MLVLSMTLAGCADEQDGWSRVVEIGDDSEFISIVHVDPLTDSCVRVNLESPSSLYVQNEEFDVDIRGADYVMWAAHGTPMNGQSCLNGFIITGLTSASGKIVFDNFINSEQAAAPCSVSFDLVITGFEGETYEIAQRDFPILDVGCPRPGVYAGEYTDLSAAYGEVHGVGNLIISSWDLEREVCVWARFSSSDDAGLATSAVEVDSPWVYSGLRFGLTERDACVASNFIAPPIDLPYASDSAPAMNSSGSLTFASSQAREFMGGQLEVPCTLDVDLSLQSQGRYYWTPDDVGMHASGVEVAGGCD